MYRAGPTLLPRLDALLARLKQMRRQIYGEGYRYDCWCEVEEELERIVKDARG